MIATVGASLFDDENNIIYSPFPHCLESDTPLALKYGENDRVNCTIQLVTELYHLFQLYLHLDAPLSCRLTKPDGGRVLFPINLSGQYLETHLEIDPSINVLMHQRNGSLVSAVGFSTAHANWENAILDTFITLQFDVEWYEGKYMPEYTSAYYTRTTTFYYCLGSFLFAGFVSISWFYNHHLPKRVRHLSVQHQLGENYQFPKISSTSVSTPRTKKD